MGKLGLGKLSETEMATLTVQNSGSFPQKLRNTYFETVTSPFKTVNAFFINWKSLLQKL